MHCKELKAKLKTKFPDSVQDSQVPEQCLCAKCAKLCKKKVKETHTWHGGDTKSGGVQRAVQCSADDNASLYLFRF